MAKPNPVMQLQKRVNTIEEQVVTLLPLVEEVHILKERLDKLISHSCVQGCRRCQTFLKEGHESLSKENQLQRDLEQRCAELETQLQQQQTRCTELEAQVQQQEARCAELEAQVQREQAHHTEAEVQVQQQQTRCAELEVQVQQEQTRCAELVMQVQQQQTRSAELEAQVQQQQTRCAEAEAKARELGAITEPSADVKQFLQSVPGTNGWKFIQAARSGNTAAIQHLISAGVNVNICDVSGFSALHHAAEGGHTETVRLLLSLRANVNARTPDNVTPLHRAAVRGHEAACEALLSAGADINVRTADLLSYPVHYAAESGALSVVQLLVCRGAKFSVSDRCHRSPRQVAILRGHSTVAEYLQGI